MKWRPALNPLYLRATLVTPAGIIESTAHMSKHPDTFDHTMANKLLGLLGALRRSESGGVLYRQIEGMLDQLISYHNESEHSQLDVINALLEAFARQLPDGSSPRVELQLLQARLKPPVTGADLDALREFLNVYADQLQVSEQLDTGPIEEAIEPLLHLFENKDVPPTEPMVAQPLEKVVPLSADLKTASVTAMGSHATLRSSVAGEPQGSESLGDSASNKEAGVPQGSGDATEHDAENTTAEVIVDNAAQSPGRQGLRDMPNDLAQQVLETISQNQEFGVLLDVVEIELREANEVDDIESLRWTIIRQVEKLAGEHHNLASKLDGTHQYLKMIESDSRQLSDELSRVRLLSLTDELTGLPNRRAFLRRLEDEVARVQRYGFPLSMALIDLDKFKQINDQYGHAGGDEVLRIYSKNILSIFRHHDLVARYGGEEFAVLLANTSTEGSSRALEKVRKRASETRWQSNDRTVPAPTFSAGLALYKPGETSSAFIERVDQALYRAKRLGRNRIELDDTYSRESDATENRTRSEPTSPGK